MDGDVEVEEAFSDDEPPPNQVLRTALVVGVLDAVIEFFAVEEVVQELFAAFTLQGGLSGEAQALGKSEGKALTRLGFDCMFNLKL